MTLALCGAIINSFGWKTAYYVTSALMLIFYLLWVYLAYDTPEMHPTITQEEKNYIKEQIGSTVNKKKVTSIIKIKLFFIVSLYTLRYSIKFFF